MCTPGSCLAHAVADCAGTKCEPLLLGRSAPGLKLLACQRAASCCGLLQPQPSSPWGARGGGGGSSHDSLTEFRCCQAQPRVRKRAGLPSYPRGEGGASARLPAVPLGRVQALQELREGVPVVKHEVAHAQEGELHQVPCPRVLRTETEHHSFVWGGGGAVQSGPSGEHEAACAQEGLLHQVPCLRAEPA